MKTLSELKMDLVNRLEMANELKEYDSARAIDYVFQKTCMGCKVWEMALDQLGWAYQVVCDGLNFSIVAK